MNPYRARKKIVAYTITAFLALCIAVLGVVFGYAALVDRQFLLHGEREALDICLKNPTMDCDPRGWRVLFIAGTVLLVLGLAFLLRLGRRLWRLVRSGSK